MQCQPGTFLKDDSNSPSCTYCTTGPNWVDEVTRKCKKCAGECGSCTSGSDCLSCSNPLSYIQVDEMRCDTECRIKEMKVDGEGLTRRCQPCPNHCSRCSEGEGCLECDAGYFKDDETQDCLKCFDGCAECQSATECLKCQTHRHFLSIDKTQCKEDCSQKEYKDFGVMRCKPCIAECDTCSDGATCEVCSPSTYLTESDKTCQACPVHCSRCESVTKCTGCSDKDHYLQPDSVGCSESCPEGSCKVDKDGKKCAPCTKGCLEFRLGSTSKCSKCQAEYELIEENCQQLPPKASPTPPPTSSEEQPPSSHPEKVPTSKTEGRKEELTQTNDNLYITTKSYSDSPSRATIIFNRPINITLTPLNTKITLLTSDRKLEIQTAINSISLSGNKKSLKIFLTIANNLENGILIIHLIEPNQITSRLQNNSIAIFTEGQIEIPNVSSYRPTSQIEATSRTAKALSYSLSIAGLLSMIGSYSSLFEIIKSFQMIDFLIYINVDHPANLKTFLDNLELKFIEYLPNPFERLKDDLCVIDKPKFEEDGVTCYLLVDQGRYLTFSITILSFLIILMILSLVTKIDAIEKIKRTMTNFTFWDDFLEAIRLEIMLRAILLVPKFSLVFKNLNSMLSLNMFIYRTFMGLNLVSVVYQTYKTNTIYRNYQKRENIIKHETLALCQHVRVDNLNIQDPNESIQSLIVNGNSRYSRSREMSRNVSFFVKRAKKKLERQLKDLPESPTCGLNENLKYANFYQRSYKRLMAMKDFNISFILVFFYEIPELQALGVTLILLIFQILDFLFRPHKEAKDNVESLTVGLLFMLVSACLTAMVFLEGVLSRRLIYYILGFGSIFLISLLILWNMLMACYTIYQGLRTISKSWAQRENKLNKVVSKVHQVDDEPRQPPIEIGRIPDRRDQERRHHKRKQRRGKKKSGRNPRETPGPSHTGARRQIHKHRFPREENGEQGGVLSFPMRGQQPRQEAGGRKNKKKQKRRHHHRFRRGGVPEFIHKKHRKKQEKGGRSNVLGGVITGRSPLEASEDHI